MGKHGVWVVLRPNGQLVEWAGASRSRKHILSVVVKGCISVHEYENAKSDSARWRIAHKRGYRFAKATLEIKP